MHSYRNKEISEGTTDLKDYVLFYSGVAYNKGAV
jgi:hypothetical protein